MPLADTFRDNLRAAMTAKGITQRELADRAGVNAVTVSRIFSGFSEPSLEMCEKLANALNMRPEKTFSKGA